VLNVDDGLDIFPVPDTVNAASDIAIASLTSTDGNDEFRTFKAGDCFEMEFSLVSSYESVKAGYYVPFPESTVQTCSLTPAATCTKVSDTLIKFTLTAGGTTTIEGKIGKIKNPFSMAQMTLSGLRYYDGCSSTVPVDTMISPMTINVNPGTIASVDFTTSKAIVGYEQQENKATFKFTPATTMSELGGAVVIQGPIWYDSLSANKKMYAYQKISCSSTAFNTITRQFYRKPPRQ